MSKSYIVPIMVISLLFVSLSSTTYLLLKYVKVTPVIDINMN